MSKQQQQQPQGGVKAFTVNTDIVDDGEMSKQQQQQQPQGGVNALTVNAIIADDGVDVKTTTTKTTRWRQSIHC